MLVVSPPSITAVVDGLVARAFVERRPTRPTVGGCARDHAGGAAALAEADVWSRSASRRSHRISTIRAVPPTRWPRVMLRLHLASTAPGCQRQSEATRDHQPRPARSDRRDVAVYPSGHAR